MTQPDEFLVIAAAGDDVVREFVDHCRKHGVAVVASSAECRGKPAPSTVVFLGGDIRERLDEVAAVRPARVVVVSSFLVHFGDRDAARREADALERLRMLRPSVLRPACVRTARAAAELRRWTGLGPRSPRRMSGCYLEPDELFSAIRRELDGPRRGRTCTLLGPNRPWCDFLREQPGRGFLRSAVGAVATVLRWLLVGHLVRLGLATFARFVPRLRSWDFDTLHPTSQRELLALVNPFNYRHVKVVGYNNGVVHFGQSHPGKTIISTVRAGRVARVHGNRATFDAGVLLRRAVEVVAAAGKEFYVLPNYSYVSVGTAFFVPIHGSSSDYSTLGDTIEKVLLYDPVADRFVAARRGSAAFADAIYDLDRDLLLLRMTFRVKDKGRDSLVRETLNTPPGATLLAALQDTGPSNVEIRKSKAASTAVDVARYYPHGTGGALEFPRDRLGRVWDKIEGNPPAAWLFHALMRRFGFHVEAFFSPDEFGAFWDTHAALPIRKIQLRYIRRDGFPHSPFRNHDCVSADLFMLRKHKAAFERYARATFPAVRFNPGKHSA